jgi:nucleoside-diphosphate-sugar epimerase
VRDGAGINIGSGMLTSFNQIIPLLAEIAGYQPEIKRLLDKPVGVQSRYASVDTLHGFGWQPQISLREGMTRVLRAAEARL